MTKRSTLNLYQGDGTRLADRGEILPPLEKPVDFTSGSAYLADPGLRDAVNVALTLGDPLLLTGEAGCGKTQLAASIAYEFDLGPPLVFNAKSTSGARDLFYRYDSLRHFHDIQVRGTREPKSVDIRRLRPVASKTSTVRRAERPKPVNVLDYIDFQALGLAVLLSKPPEEVAKYLKHRDRDRGPRRSVVLIDEIDKAPRDLPNDLLNEIEEMEFTVPEIGKRFQAEAGYRPIVIITSNTEKNLPEAFLRRCVFYHIEFPNRQRLAEIVRNRINPSDRLNLEEAIDWFLKIREKLRDKKPGTAELLAWITILERAEIDLADPGAVEAIAFTYATLAKTEDDRKLLRDLKF